MLVRCMYIAPNRHMVKIKSRDYIDFLNLSYKDFYEATHIWGTVGIDPYDYRYCVSEKNDSKETRLNYICYLVNQKGFNV